MVEYVVLVGAVALVVGAGLMAFGLGLMTRFEAERAAILRPTVESSF